MRRRLKRHDHLQGRTPLAETETRPRCHNVDVTEDDSFSVEMESDPDDVLTVTLDGELDMAEADWVEATLAAAAPHHRRMDVDLHGVSFIDSTGIRTLVTLKQRATVMGLELGFTNPSAEVTRALRAAELVHIVESSPPSVDDTAGSAHP